jgi:hypothetical protein
MTTLRSGSSMYEFSACNKFLLIAFFVYSSPKVTFWITLILFWIRFIQILQNPHYQNFTL